MSELDIIEGCLKEDHRFQRLLVANYAPMLLSVSRRYCPAYIGAEDILQDAFIKIFEKIKQFNPDKGSLATWMRKIVINTALKKMNKRAFTHEKSTDVFEEIPFSPSAYEHLEAEDIMKLIATLPEGYRQVFSLHAIEGYSHKEIGQLLNIQEVTSRSNHQTPTDLDALWKGIEAKKQEKPTKKRAIWFFWLGGLLLIGGIAALGFSLSNEATTAVLEESAQKSTANSTNSNAAVINSTSTATTTKAKRIKQQKSISSKVASTAAIGESEANFTKATSILNAATDGTNRNQIANASNFNPPLLEKVVETELPFIVTPEVLSPLAQIENQLFKQQAIALTTPLVKPNKPSPFSIDVYSGIGLASRQLNYKAGAEQTAHLDFRNKLETPEQVLTAGANIQYQFKSGWFLKSGLAYEQITERFDYTFMASETDFYNEDALNTIYRMADGTVNLAYGTNSIEQVIQTRLIYNRYRTIDVPLIVGYNKKINRRMSLYAEGGALLNVAFLPRGEILAMDNETIIDLSDTDILKQNIGLSAAAGVGFSYKIGQTWSVWASPQLRYALGSMTTDSYNVDQSFVRGIVQVGLKKQL